MCAVGQKGLDLRQNFDKRMLLIFLDSPGDISFVDAAGRKRVFKDCSAQLDWVLSPMSRLNAHGLRFGRPCDKI